MEVNRLVGEISDLQPAAAADSCSRVSCAPDLPPHQRAALPVSTHEVRHRGGDDPQGPLRRLQPACELYSEEKKKTKNKRSLMAAVVSLVNATLELQFVTLPWLSLTLCLYCLHGDATS